MARITVMVITMLMALSVCGCYESVEFTWYEPGAYKGADDPLTQRIAASDLNQRLMQRINQVQTDR